MITLITGVPGSGKTTYAMSFLIDASSQGRPVFVHGIPGLTLKHEQVFCSANSCEVCQSTKRSPGDLIAEEWHIWAPDFSYIVFDECQNIYRPRNVGSEPPGSVKAFETHRHRGIDFLLLSQSPMLFDSNIRRLVSAVSIAVVTSAGTAASTIPGNTKHEINSALSFNINHLCTGG